MITMGGAKMSSSKGNTVSAVETVERYGADTARTYVCFLGPPERGGDWVPEGVEGVHRFLVRLWRLSNEVVERTEARATSDEQPEAGPARELLAKTAWAIDKATRDISHGFQLHTAIAAVMELVNDAYRLKDELYGDPAGEAALRFATATAASLIFPFAPHLGSRGLRRAHRRAGLGAALAAGRPGAARPATTFTLVVQVNGKRRDQIVAAAGASEAEVLELARGERERPPPPRRQAGRQGDRRPRQARQPRRPLSGCKPSHLGVLGRRSRSRSWSYARFARRPASLTCSVFARSGPPG